MWKNILEIFDCQEIFDKLLRNIDCKNFETTRMKSRSAQLL